VGFKPWVPLVSDRIFGPAACQTIFVYCPSETTRALGSLENSIDFGTQIIRLIHSILELATTRLGGDIDLCEADKKHVLTMRPVRPRANGDEIICLTGCGRRKPSAHRVTRGHITVDSCLIRQIWIFAEKVADLGAKSSPYKL